MVISQSQFLKCMWFDLDDNMLLFSIPSLLLFHYKNHLSSRVLRFWIEFVCFEEEVECSWNRRCLRFTIFLWSETHLSMYLSMYLSFFQLFYLLSVNYSNAQKSGTFSQVGCVQPWAWRVGKRRVEGLQLKPVYAAVLAGTSVCGRASWNCNLTHGSYYIGGGVV